MKHTLLALLLLCGCGDDDGAMPDAGPIGDAGPDVAMADAGPEDDGGPGDDGGRDAGADVVMADAGPPPPVRRSDDGFVVRNGAGEEFTLCGCTDDALALSLGPTLPAVAGRPVTIFFDNLIGGAGADYAWTTYAAVAPGDTMADRWTLTSAEPLADELFIVAWDDETPVGVSSTMVTVSAADAGAGTDASILFLGDSTTAGGVYARAMLALFDEDPMNVTTVGTVVTGTASHEGRSGWRIADYFDDNRGPDANPFFNSATGGFDYAYYLSENGIEAPDYFAVHLGINDVFTIADDAVPGRIDRMLERLDGFFANILSVAPETRLAVALTIMPCSTESGFTENYMGRYPREPYKLRIAEWSRRVIEHFAGSDVQLVPLNATIDTVYGFPNEDDGMGGVRHTNAVHPNSDGYGQMGETFYNWLKGQ